MTQLLLVISKLSGATVKFKWMITKLLRNRAELPRISSPSLRVGRVAEPDEGQARATERERQRGKETERPGGR